jgi:hypothetical protein
LSFFLHRDYLVTQSTLFQKLLDPTHNASSSSAPVPMPATADPSMSSFPERNGSSQTARNVGAGGEPVTPGSAPIRINGAKILTTAPGALTTVWLPLPDPKSFGVLAHWLYWYVLMQFCSEQELISLSSGATRHISKKRSPEDMYLGKA